MKSQNLHVLPLGAAWAVKFEDEKKFELITRNRIDAIEFAENLCQTSGAKLLIHDMEEHIEENIYHWEKYNNRKYGFSIQYRDDFLLNEAYVYYFGGSDTLYKGVSFGIPTSFVQGTNLSADTFISVEVLPIEKGCKARNYITQMDKTYEEDKVINGINFNYAEIEEVGVGNIYEEKLYTYSGKKDFCFGIRLFLHSHRFEFYDPEEVKRFDRKSILDIFKKMLTTFSPLSDNEIACGSNPQRGTD